MDTQTRNGPCGKVVAAVISAVEEGSSRVRRHHKDVDKALFSQ